MKYKSNFQKNTFPFLSLDLMVSKIIPICLIVILTTFFIMYYLQTTNNSFNAISIHRNNSKYTNGSIETSSQIQENIASEILRFHVIANSDSTEDQALKLIIKDALVKALIPTLENATNIMEARSLLKSSLDELEDISNGIIKEHGFTYTASASLERGYFPLKVYGDLSLPPGEYEAVRIELGSAKGQNWWCVMYPPLCFVDATYSVVPDSSKAELRGLLTNEEYEAIFSAEKVNIKIRFKLLSWIENLVKEEK